MNKETALRIKIAEAATKRYVENERFTIQSLAGDLKLNPSDIFDLFPNRSSILRFYYESRFLLYKDQVGQIEDYSNFSLSEKLNTLLLTMLDLFQNEREFVLMTYRHMVADPFGNKKYEYAFKTELKEIFNSDSRLATSAKPFINSLFYQSLYLQFHGLILFWKYDESRMYENSMALIDKWCALVEEICYSKVFDKGFDLGKFLLYNSPFFKSNLCLTSYNRVKI